MKRDMRPAAAEYTIADQQRMERARNYFAWQAALVKPALGRRVVEAGCGIGNFTKLLLDRELVISLDPDPELVAIVQKRYPAVHAMVREVGRDAISDLAGFTPDSCLFVNVLEHIENDARAIRDAAAILAPGGTVVIIAPAFPALSGPIDRELGHYRRYTRGSLIKLAEASNLKIEKLRYMNMAGFFGWWMNSHIFRRQAQSEAQIDFFDRYIVPVMSCVEAMIKPPFGQSLFAVFRKPIS